MVSTASDRISGLSSELAIKAPVTAATTANITLSGTQTIDGVAVVADDRVLVKNQTTGTEDGIYIVKASTWERSRDWNGSRDAVNGTIVIVKAGGTTNGNTLWRASATDNPYVIDTVSPTFVLAEFLIDISGRVTYTFDSSTTVSADPGDGDFRLNNATIASATVISFSDNTTDDGNPDYSPYLITWDDSTNSSLRGTITISELGDPSVFAVFSVNGAVTDGTTYVDVPVAYVSGSGSFTSGSKYVVSFARTGNLGASGGVQMKWDASTDDADQGAGTVWLDNATVASATIVYLDDVEDAAGASINSWVDSFDDSTATIQGTLTIAVQANPAVFAVFNVTGAVTSASTYSKVASTYVTGAGSFTADDKVVVSFARAGDDGAGDVVGPASATDNSLAKFDGTTGKLLKDGAVIGTDVQAYNVDTLFADVDDVLTAGFAYTDVNDGTKSSGTYTPVYTGGNAKYIVNGGAFTLAPQAVSSQIIIQMTNNASAGAVTTSGYTIVDGAALTTTDGDDFLLVSTVVNSFKNLHVVALQ